MDSEKDKLVVIATKTLDAWDEMYKVVDFLNKNLREKQVMFGLNKNKENNTMTISIYEV